MMLVEIGNPTKPMAIHLSATGQLCFLASDPLFPIVLAPSPSFFWPPLKSLQNGNHKMLSNK